MGYMNGDVFHEDVTTYLACTDYQRVQELRRTTSVPVLAFAVDGAINTKEFSVAVGNRHMTPDLLRKATSRLLTGYEDHVKFTPDQYSMLPAALHTVLSNPACPDDVIVRIISTPFVPSWIRALPFNPNFMRFETLPVSVFEAAIVQRKVDTDTRVKIVETTGCRVEFLVHAYQNDPSTRVRGAAASNWAFPANLLKDAVHAHGKNIPAGAARNPRIEWSDLWDVSRQGRRFRVQVVSHPDCPQDVLLKYLTGPKPLPELVARHPNATDEMKVVLALLDT
jgi:hypothetical protein